MNIRAEDLPNEPPRFSFRTPAEIDGRPGELVIEASSFNDLAKAVALVNRASPPPAATEWRTLPDGTPLCPRHGVPMRKRERQGDSWWSHNAGGEGDDLWCRGYRGKDSPGYDY